MKKSRTHYTPQEKVIILRRHLLDRIEVSDLCEELKLAPNLFYRWQKEFFENGSAAFASKPGPGRPKAEEKRIALLEDKLRRKDEVLGELLEEHLRLKKNLGEL